MCDEYHAVAFLIPGTRVLVSAKEKVNRERVCIPLSLRSLGVSSCARTTAVSLSSDALG